jgi:chromosome segregation ATPase
MAAGITEQDVWKAADALLLEGARPTIERVRQKIGRGSPNTVSPALETWFRSLGGRMANPASFAAPAAVPDPVGEAAAHFWQVAMSHARAEQAREAEATAAASTAEQQRLASWAESLAAREQQLEVREHDLEQGFKGVGRQLAAAEQRLRATEAQLEQCGAQWREARQEAAAAQAQVRKLGEEIEVQRAAQIEALEAQQARHAVHERRWLNEIDAERTAFKRLQASAESARKQGEQAVAALRGEQDVAAQEIRRLELDQGERLSQIGVLAAQIHAQQAAAQDAATALRAREREWQGRLEQAQAQASVLLEQLGAKDSLIEQISRGLLAAAPNAAAAKKPATRRSRA